MAKFGLFNFFVPGNLGFILQQLKLGPQDISFLEVVVKSGLTVFENDISGTVVIPV